MDPFAIDTPGPWLDLGWISADALIGGEPPINSAIQMSGIGVESLNNCHRGIADLPRMAIRIRRRECSCIRRMHRARSPADLSTVPAFFERR